VPALALAAEEIPLLDRVVVETVSVETVAMAAVRGTTVAAPLAVTTVTAPLGVAAVAGHAADAASRRVTAMMRVPGGGESWQGDRAHGEQRRRCHERVEPERAGHVAGAS
jgi:hypothetical protein